MKKNAELGCEWDSPLPKSHGVVKYWRKANAIHRWFVENVQDGVDDQGEYSVRPSDLRRLRDTCAEVISSSKLIEGDVIVGTRLGKAGRPEPIVRKGQVISDARLARELLPAMDGFNFGSLEYDQDYLLELRETETVLSAVLSVLVPDEPESTSTAWRCSLAPDAGPVNFSYKIPSCRELVMS